LAANPPGQGGEGGERGVDPAAAATDPAIFLGALDAIAAHYYAGRDAYRAGEREAATEMFAHPIGEVYLELESILVGRGIAPFEAEMLNAVELAGAGASADEVDAAVGQVLGRLREAAAEAPAAELPAAAVEGRVLAEMLDRAALMYWQAASDPAGEAYLDGYGYLRAAEARAETSLAAIQAKDPAAAAATEEALALLRSTFPTVQRPETLTVDPGLVLSTASVAMLKLGSL
jgi:hypothetical protein